MFYPSRTVFIPLAMYCYVLLVPKNTKACFLRRCCLNWERKQHTFGSFGLVNNKSFLRVQNAFLGLKGTSTPTKESL